MQLAEILSLIEELPPGQRQELVDTALKATKDLVWVPNDGPQRAAYECEADELFYGGSAGGGKESDVNELVLTPTGWVKIGSLKVGTKLCAVDGTVTEVIGVYPQGVKPNYRLTFTDGTSCLAGLNHNWLGWWTGKSRKAANVKICGESSAQKYTTAEIIAGMDRRGELGCTRKFAIPVISAPAAFNVPGCPRKSGKGGAYVRREVDPYLLGLIIGDGCVSVEKRISMTTADTEIVDYVQQWARGDVSVDTREGNAAVSVRIVGAARMFLVEQFCKSRLGLTGHKAESKFIPYIYLFGSAEERWSLLQGLMDTDGWVEADGDGYYCTVSPQLAQDVAHLARSLGAIVSVREKEPTYTHNGEKRNGQRAYTLRIKIRDSSRLFRLERKKRLCTGEPQSMAKYVESIEYSHDAESVCIQVRHPSSLYITRDFIVTHNTDLIVGLSLTKHKRSLILRRTNKEASKLFDRFYEVLGHREGWNSQQSVWRFNDGRVIDIGGCEHEEDKQKWKGVPHSLKAFDEISDFTESQFRFISIWNRSADPAERCRVVACGNPPTTPEGLWVIQYWAPWLDPTHPRPARPGELRWFIADEEVDGPGPHLFEGKMVRARSRTFIPAMLEDNPDLVASGYDSVLASLPEELRQAYREGRFDTAMRDDAYQVVPTSWIKAAQARWTEKPPLGIPMCAIGVDVAQGGTDETVLAIRHDGWFAPLISVPGSETPGGASVAGLVIQHRRDGARVVIDMGGGYGGAALEHLRANIGHEEVVAYKGSEGSTRRTVDRQLAFTNKRSEAYWRFREALDPTQPGGSPIMLPSDPALVADLAAPKFEVGPNGIKITPKEKLIKDLGRSPDRGDAVVMAWSSGAKATTHGAEWREDQKFKLGRRAPVVDMGRRRR